MEKKRKAILTIFAIVAVMVIGLWGVDVEQGYMMVSEITTSPQDHVGQKVSTMGLVKNGTLSISTEMVSFTLTDAEDEEQEIYIEYIADLPANLVEGNSVSLTGTMISESKIEADQIVIGCPSKYSE
ncbi:cytochrome c maturation protein CcmE domain-containing protein [Methanococcoides alaskense]|uniref:Cytochrome c-type biogenesis protein CcmE n=1 Tax=Methanococcoides alaskense TaxID=325778 RepID=A0AA90TXK2_9EURY|nr:cytochrome c maturation protein CcmE [Methanococcoides alaskense]MDA0525228.1 cytochrome c maturation protein CcmE [Methanococcoides alaskense]MDR6221849.1 cytochrome c-type biogenesis protein CcmE [Methanococcoides alaskense]